MNSMPRLRRLAVVVAATLILGAAASAEGTDVGALIGQGKFDEAIQLARRAVAANPKDPDARARLAHALAAKGRTVERVVDVSVGRKEIESGVIALPRIGPDRPGRPEVRYDPVLFEGSVEQIREAVRLSPARRDLRLTECYLFTDAGDIERAAAAIKAALAALPREGSLAQDLASFPVERARRGDLQGARILFGPVAAAFPGDAAVQSDFARVLAREGRRGDAQSALDRARSAASPDPRIHREIAATALILRDFRRARSAYQAAFERSRQDGDRLGAAVSAFRVDSKIARVELQELTTPAASADPALVALAERLVESTKGGAASKAVLAEARRLKNDGQDLLAIPLLDRALRSTPGNRDFALLLAEVLRGFGAEALAAEVLAPPPTAPPPASPPKR